MLTALIAGAVTIAALAFAGIRACLHRPVTASPPAAHHEVTDDELMAMVNPTAAELAERLPWTGEIPVVRVRGRRS